MTLPNVRASLTEVPEAQKNIPEAQKINPETKKIIPEVIIQPRQSRSTRFTILILDAHLV